MQPSGLPDAEWLCVPFPDLCHRQEMERWVERKRYVEEKQEGEGGNKNKTDVNHCWVAGGSGCWCEDKRLIERAEEPLKDGRICAEQSDG